MRGGFLLTNGSQDLCCDTERRTGLCRQRGATQGQVKVGGLAVRLNAPEPIFLNVYGAQESIPRNELRQPM
jgi:hypothetical protein